MADIALRPDLAAIFDAVAPGSRVLDIGCGDGTLLAALRDEKQVDARGIEIDGACVCLLYTSDAADE